MEQDIAQGIDVVDHGIKFAEKFLPDGKVKGVLDKIDAVITAPWFAAMLAEAVTLGESLSSSQMKALVAKHAGA